MPSDGRNFIQGPGILGIGHGNLEYVMPYIAGVELQDVKRLTGIQACLFPQLTYRGGSGRLPRLHLAAR